jgi:hypothetical protein
MKNVSKQVAWNQKDNQMDNNQRVKQMENQQRVNQMQMENSQRVSQMKAVKSQLKWIEDSPMDSIANPNVCLAGESLDFVNDPLAYIITGKLGVDVTDNESFSVTCCFHFDV